MIPIKKGLSLALFFLLISSAAAMAQSHTSTNAAQAIGPVHDFHYGSMAINTTEAPQLQGATMGTIGPQDVDATQISGLMTAGTVRVNNLANLEAALNIIANLALVAGHIIGIYYLVRTIRLTVKTPGNVLGGMAKGFTFISIGLVSPMFINWAIATARDASMFN